MSQKSDYFFLNIKQVYPNFARPSALETEIWEEMLEPYTQGDILAGIKSYRKSEDTNFAPNPARFRSYLYSRAKKAEKPCLPLSPESYLMEEDIRAGRCRHLFPTYCKAVEYVLEVELKKLYSEAELRRFRAGGNTGWQWKTACLRILTACWIMFMRKEDTDDDRR